ncbi:putative capsid protein [Chimpanzee associated porprismacovirus 1]|uniref:Capsid protein n=1 Tax=Chimpanzee stool associated circular ssDNA virus TaxID=702718 RepID=D2WKE2_9VIRU|nr:putative capsid protein [Chimpanzee associated porprismacovirus 1]ADB24798.1 putative capsid protein [Chimpanzee associated porprismacovirus 1]
MFVKVSETYDLSTQTDKMGFVGIHTPEGKLVYNMWSGLFKNFRKFRYASCDVTMACASMLPADPLQIGVEAGDIAPQDMFNPILYKACSNDSMSVLLNRLYAGADASTSAINKNSVVAQNDESFGYDADNDVDQFAMYYGLLADSDGWRKAMPQAGLQMHGRKPLVFGITSNFGQPSNVGLPNGKMVYTGNGDGSLTARNTIDSTLFQYMRGPTMGMPALDTFVQLGGSTVVNGFADSVTVPEVSDRAYPISNGSITTPGNVCTPNLDTPDCFVAAIVLPPAKLNRLYYRMKVTWTIEFSGLRPDTDLTNWYGLALAGVQSYGSDYLTQTATIARATSTANTSGMVDTGDVSLTKVMEGAS